MLASTATTTLRAAMTTPSASTAEPTYRGCRIQRYGPERVTSRPFSRCPAAHTRIASPAAATRKPAVHVFQVGCARISAAIAVTNPSETRRRARTVMILLITLRRQAAPLDSGRDVRSESRRPDHTVFSVAVSVRAVADAPFDGGEYFLDRDVLDARLVAAALSLVVTGAAIDARDGNIR